MNKSLKLFATVVATSLLSANVQADSLIDGIYKSAGDANGRGQCTLTIKSVDEPHKYGDEMFEMESTGDGACEWSAVVCRKAMPSLPDSSPMAVPLLS